MRVTNPKKTRGKPRVLNVPWEIIVRLEQHALGTAPGECVGFLFGRDTNVFRHVPLTNVAETPKTHFFAEPMEMLRALTAADKVGETLLAVYHSHPKGPAQLSEDDVQHVQPGLVQLLLTPEGVFAFVVVNGAVEEVRLEF